MPVSYQNCKIYKIISPSNPELIYYGHTCRTLEQRMSEHQTKNNNTQSKIIITKGDAIIELIENYPCNNRSQALRKEGEYIKNNSCVNKVIAGRTDKEYREDHSKQVSIDRMEKTHAKAWGFGNDVKAYDAWCKAGRP